MKKIYLISVLILWANTSTPAQAILNYPNALSQSIPTTPNQPLNHSMETDIITIHHADLNAIITTIQKLYPDAIITKHPNQNAIILKSKNNKSILSLISTLNNTNKTITFSIQIYETTTQFSKHIKTLLEPFQTGANVSLTHSALLETKDLQNILKLLNENSNASLKANPKLVIQNNTSGTFEIGDLIPYLTVTNTTSGQYNTLNQLETGIKMTLHPKITNYPNIETKIQFDMSSIKLWKTIESNEYPVLSYRNIDTSITIKHNKSLIIAGLLDTYKKNNYNSIPFIENIPIIKHLFFKKTNEKQSSEICIILTPMISKKS